MTQLFICISLLMGSFVAHALPLPKMERSQVILPFGFTQNYNFEGIVALSNCSGSLVKLENGKDTDPAMVLTNGHCYEGGFIKPGTEVINKSSSRTFRVLTPTADTAGTVRA